MISNLDQRMVFENAARLAQMQGYTINEAKCTQGVIRSEVAMSSTSGNYQLPILVNQQQQAGGASRVLSIPLQLQDLFYVSSVGVFWTAASASTTNGKLYSYPNPTGAGSAAKAADLNNLYNGYLQITADNVQFVQNWDLLRHLKVNQTQENTNFNAASATSPAQYTIDQINGSEDGFYPVEPGWILNGAGKIDARVVLPGGFTNLVTNGAIVVIFRGLVLQGTTNVK